MTFLILHGVGGHAGIHWQQWLHNQLASKKHTVIMPTLPNADNPDRNTWLSEIKEITKNVNPNGLVIIGHSLGVVTALDFIETITHQIKGLVSVSGFAKDYGSELNSSFMKEQVINFDKVKSHLLHASVIYGDNDPYVPQEVLSDLSAKLNVVPQIIHNGGHLNTEAGFTTLPVLLKVIEEIADSSEKPTLGI